MKSCTKDTPAQSDQEWQTTQRLFFLVDAYP